MEEKSTKHVCAQQCSGHSPNKESSKKDKIDDHVNYDHELGEENVELVDSEWADFERALR